MLNYEDNNSIVEFSSLVFFQSNLKEVILEMSESSSLQCNDIGVLLKTRCYKGSKGWNHLIENKNRIREEKKEKLLGIEKMTGD